ncbi:MAG: FxsA family protein [Alphaproteobacteria bacterium]|nr:FxsA family protein [Alphaproteobacteria bacterium]
MFLKLFLAFTIIPAVELYLLIRIGEVLGPALTVLLILVTGAVGASLAKREGFSVLRRIQDESRAGFPSGDRIVEGLLVVIGGLLLVTPGVMTDAAGLTLIAPPTRRWLAPRVKAWLLARVQVAGVSARFGADADIPRHQGDDTPRPRNAPPGAKPFDHPTL